MLDFRIAPAVKATAAPPIPRAQAWAAFYRSSPQAASAPVLDLSQGVPGSAPHTLLLEALARTSSDPTAARYGPILGEPCLRSALADEFNTTYSLPSDSGHRLSGENIGITTGCNMAFLVLLMTICPPGSKVLIPLPAYFNQSMSLSLQSVEPVYIPCLPSEGFKPSIEGTKRYLQSDLDAEEEEEGTRQIRMIVLVTPNNPTGAIYTHSELQEWYDLAKEYKVALVLDETYRDFVDGKPHELFAQEGWGRTLVSIGSMSKGYRIPGHRLGSIIAAPELLEEIATVADCMQICAPRPPQLALASALPHLRSDLAESSKALMNRLSLFEGIISRLEGWKVTSMGGFYAYVQFPSVYTTHPALCASASGPGSGSGEQGAVGSEEVAKYLAVELGVICLPGSFFMPDLRDGKVWAGIEGAGGGALRSDRWLRFAIANVDDAVIVSLEPRLRRMNELMGVS